MNPTFRAACAVLSLLGSSALAADAPAPTTSSAAAPRRDGPLVSPEINADGGVTFRIRAPKAGSVKVSGQFGPDAEMTKDDKGVWSVTIPSVAGGIYEYHFSVDGLNIIDPQNSAVKPQRWPGSSILHIPSTPPAPWDLQDVPRGTVHEHTYLSKALNKWRSIVVYTPPNAPADGTLPVLYLAHGYSDNEKTWTAHGKANSILDSLIATGKAMPMIIVMPDAHAIAPGASGFEDYGPANTKAFCDELLQDVIPLVEKTYKPKASPEARAFAGLSMGGHHALTVALEHHDQFGWVGAFSSAPPPKTLVTAGLEHPDAVNHDLKLFWIGVGTKDFLHDRNNEFTALLKEKGIKFEYHETEGDHSWPVWRRYLIEFAPKLFRS